MDEFGIRLRWEGLTSGIRKQVGTWVLHHPVPPLTGTFQEKTHSSQQGEQLWLPCAVNPGLGLGPSL